MNAAILHTAIVIAAVCAYVILTALGHDGNAVFAFLGGQAAGGIVQAKAT